MGLYTSLIGMKVLSQVSGHAQRLSSMLHILFAKGTSKT